jgi:hypothetical protein
MFSKKHLEGFKRYAELADVIERWLEDTSRRCQAERLADKMILNQIITPSDGRWGF